MKLADLNVAVKRYEQQLAPGSESILLGDYNENMRKLCGVVGVCGEPGDAEVPDASAAWWLGAYAAEVFAMEVESEPDNPRHGGRVADATVGDWDSEAWAQDKLVLPEAARDDLWPDYKTGFDERLAALRQIDEASDHAVAEVQEHAATAHCLHLKAADVGFDLRKSGTAVKIPPADSLQAVWDGGSVLGTREAVIAELRKAGFTIAE